MDYTMKSNLIDNEKMMMRKKVREFTEENQLMEQMTKMTMMMTTTLWLRDLKKWSNNSELKFKQNKKMKIIKDMNHINHQMLRNNLPHFRRIKNCLNQYNSSSHLRYSSKSHRKLQLGQLVLVVQSSIKSKIQNCSKSSCKKNK